MLIKFLKVGLVPGCGKNAISYLLGEKNGKRQKRHVEPEVLRGNPDLTAKLIDSLEYKHKYSSAVISFHPEDKPTVEQINETVDRFLDVAFAGLDRSQVDATVVLHREPKSEDVHIIIPRVELSTGKSFNAAPTGWQKDFDPLRDYLNEKYGWVSPDIDAHPENARLVRTGKEAVFKDKDRLGTKEAIEEFLVLKATSGRIQDRDDVIEVIESLGFQVTRRGKDYISISHDDLKKPMRLKGVFFNEGWKLERNIESAARTREESVVLRKHRADRAYKEIESRIESRAAYNQKRYPQSEPRSNRDVQEKLGRKPTNDSELSKSSKIRLDKATVDHDSGVDYFDSVNVGADVVYGVGNPISNNGDQAERTNASAVGSHGRQVELEPVRQEDLRSDRRESIAVSRQLSSGEVNDRNREEAIRAGQSDGREAQQGNSAISTASAAINEASQRLEHSVKRFVTSFRTGVQRMIKNSADEIDEFKKRINLVEFAASFGYKVIKSKSTRKFRVMAKDEKGQKIGIYTAPDGHGLYFELGVQGVKSVIDMCQEEVGGNLGQVRKYLRGWSGYSDVQNYAEYKKPTFSEPDVLKIRRELELMTRIESNNKYLMSRGIIEDILLDNRFLILKDKRGNTIFYHTDEYNDVVGYEVRNTNWKQFSESGIKGLWLSKNIRDAEKIVICESAIDALSHAQIHKTSNETAYASLSGQISDSQFKALKKRCAGKFVVIATDNDDAGDRYDAQIRESLKDVAAGFIRERPTQKDWNDDLKFIEQGHSDHKADVDLR